MTNKPSPARGQVVKISPSKLNPRTSEWTSETGAVLKLRPISWLAVQRITSGNPKTRPPMPKATVTYANGQVAEEANPNDPEYILAMEDWTRDSQYRSMQYALGTGVVVAVPDEFKRSHLEFFPEASETELRCLYVMSQITQDEFMSLFDAIMGKTGPTEDGVEDATQSFRGDSER